MSGILVREGIPDDRTLLEGLYSAAFPDEDLRPLVQELLKEDDLVLSLVATIDRTLTGHCLFTRCSIGGIGGAAWLLAPLAVLPRWHRQGIGSSLVRAGLTRLGKDGRAASVFVLGAPDYYGRFGFKMETEVNPPYPLPPEWRTAWQSLSLRPAQAVGVGTLVVPRPWRRPTLWAP